MLVRVVCSGRRLVEVRCSPLQARADDVRPVARSRNGLSRPAVSLWEHRLARWRLRAGHRGEVDEAGLFTAVEEMCTAGREAARLTRSARRDRAGRDAAPELPAAPPRGAPVPAETAIAAPAGPEQAADTAPPLPFDGIEQW